MKINITIEDTTENLSLLATHNGWIGGDLETFLTSFVESIIFDRLSDPVMKIISEQTQAEIKARQEEFAQSLQDKISVNIE